MNRIFEAALDIQSACLSHRWKFCIIGAVAVQRWGEPRLTRDVDQAEPLLELKEAPAALERLRRLLDERAG